jgi:hypothetical protein
MQPVLRIGAIGAGSAALYGLIALSGRWLAFGGGSIDEQRLGAAIGFAMAVSLLVVLYALLLHAVSHGLLAGPGVRLMAFAFPVLINIGLVLDRPSLSEDALTYVAYGYLATQSDSNPYTHSTQRLLGTSVGDQLTAQGWYPRGPSDYGPLWTAVSTRIVQLTPDVGAAVLAHKALTTAASLASAALLYVVLGRVWPSARLLGTLTYLWNPLVTLEFAREGHNDALMILAALTALSATVARRPAASLCASAVGVLTKYLPVLLVPAQLVYLWRVERAGRRDLVVRLAVGFAFSGALASLVLAPFWEGAGTFATLLNQGRVNAGPFNTSLARLAITGAVVAWATWRVRDAPTLLAACSDITTVYALFGSATFWPWYMGLPIAMLSACAPRRSGLTVVMVSTLCAELYAPLEVLRLHDQATTDTLVWAQRLLRNAALLTYLTGRVIESIQHVGIHRNVEFAREELV